MTDKTDERVLLPCPFCGAKDRDSGLVRYGIGVWCNCGAKHNSADAWNARAERVPVSVPGWSFKVEGDTAQVIAPDERSATVHALGSWSERVFFKLVAALASAPASDDDFPKCNVCGRPVRYGDRHHQCGLASAPVPDDRRALDALDKVRAFLTDPRWGQWSYMEGSEVYDDIREAIENIDAARAAMKEREK